MLALNSLPVLLSKKDAWGKARLGGINAVVLHLSTQRKEVKLPMKTWLFLRLSW